MLSIAKRLYLEGNIQESERLYRKILFSFPKHTKAIHGLGELCIQIGKREEGLSLLQKAIVLEPTNRMFNISIAQALIDMDVEQALFHFQKGLPDLDGYVGLIVLLGTLDRGSEAHTIIFQLAQTDIRVCLELGKRLYEEHKGFSSICFQALRNSPFASLEIIFECAQFYIDAQNIDKALPFLEQSCILHPQMRESYILIGDIHMQSQRYSQALQAYQEANTIDPAHHEAYSKLACAAMALEKYDIAKELFHRSLSRKSDQSFVHHQIANIFYEEGDVLKAESHWKEALLIEPTNRHCGYRLVQFLFSSYPPRYQEAESILVSLLEKHPRESSLFNMMAHLCFIQGDRDKALLYYQKTIACNPNHTSAYHQLARYAPEPLIDEIPIWKELLIHGGLKDDKRSHLAFALGSTFDRIGDVASAFTYFEMANRIERRHRICSIPSIQSYLQQQCDSFASLTPPSLQEDVRFIFVVGMMRSGSTLLEQLMCSHRDVYSVGELPRIPQLVAEYTDQDVDSVASLIRSQYIQTIERYPDRQKVCLDKLLGNFAYIGWIRHAFPDARILHCRRDPMDTSWSIYRHRFIGNHPYAYNLDELAEYYLLYQQVMKFWKDRYPDFILDVQYEDVVLNANVQCTAIDTFCSLDVSVIRNSHRENQAMISTPSGINARKEIYTDSVGRSKRYVSFLNPIYRRLHQD